MKRLANTSLKDDIYNYLNGLSAITSSVDQIGWRQMPDTAVTKKQIVYGMISDVRIPESSFRSQRWRFWICFPVTGLNPKTSCLSAANKLLDAMHSVRGEFGSVNLHYAFNLDNQDPFFDTNSNSWIIIQDYELKMRTLN